MLAPIPRWLLIVLLVLPISAWALDPESQAAKDEGMRPYNAHQRMMSMPYLEIAARIGDVETMYYLAEVYRLRRLCCLRFPGSGRLPSSL
ncbi:hypothetical protein GCM10008997_12760 [Halomonas salifodinae]